MQEWYQSRALYETINGLLKKRDFDLALQVARGIPDKGIKATSYSKIVVEMAKRGVEYEEALKEAIEAIMELDTDAKIRALMSLAFELINLGKFEDALKLGELIPDVSNRSKIKAEAALKIAERGDIPRALNLINDILDEDVKTWATSMLVNKMSRREE
ncbi:hypothetical protein DRN43_05375 [Thermococci archaeon]|uniref:hypothetical protein n=1 Tax=Palaeococcus sp. (in: euryarchaeotes) TaxID=2820298 RepID=UPI000F1A2408|nr:hypothetical protein [Palaeococcus sp. (in: euryarchaeotes)]MCD6558698.1 hypothetical protein [Palaeococcus sp. (in: euryarchaeotes)]RLF88663.1 MAG: hypothetical protein DRN43_05375 [Thermococci archaeon]